MNSRFNFRVNHCDCDDFECDDVDYVYEVTGYACGGLYFDGSDTPIVNWDTVDVSDDDYERALVMEAVIAQISADIDDGIKHHFCQIGGAFYLADWEFENANESRYRNRKTGKMVTTFWPSRLTIILIEVDHARVAAYV